MNMMNDVLAYIALPWGSLYASPAGFAAGDVGRFEAGSKTLETSATPSTLPLSSCVSEP